MAKAYADKARASAILLLTIAPVLVQALFALPVSTSAYAQGKTEFSDQLRRAFGGFKDVDLERAFQRARAIQCSDLISDSGEWREVGFFNENRGLGDWFRNNLDELKSRQDVYTFSGACGKRQSPVWVTTRFPVDQLHVKVNAPVVARFDGQTQVYTFDLPYLFRVSDKSEDPLYALNPRSLSDHYAVEVVNRWECKSVEGEDVTYRFLICRTGLISRKGARTNGKPSYGMTAFSILSDGREASASVELSFPAAGQP
jgi:hypothetical protein